MLMSTWNGLGFILKTTRFNDLDLTFFWEITLYTVHFRFKTLQDVFIHLELCYTLHERSFSKIHNRGTLSAASHAYSAGHDRSSGMQNKYLKEYLSLLPLLWQPTTAQLNPPHIFIFSYIEKVSIQSIFFSPVLTCISMETGLSCRARWQIATAAHNIRVLIGKIACKLSSLRTVNWVPGASTNPENVKKNNSVNFVMVSLSLQACEKMSHSDFAPTPPPTEKGILL